MSQSSVINSYFYAKYITLKYSEFKVHNKVHIALLQFTYSGICTKKACDCKCDWLTISSSQNLRALSIFRTDRSEWSVHKWNAPTLRLLHVGRLGGWIPSFQMVHTLFRMYQLEEFVDQPFKMLHSGVSFEFCTDAMPERISEDVPTCLLPHKFCWPHQTERLFQYQNSERKMKVLHAS